MTFSFFHAERLSSLLTSKTCYLRLLSHFDSKTAGAAYLYTCYLYAQHT